MLATDVSQETGLGIIFSSMLLILFLCLHSRHCGRLLCHKCSTKEIPIIKFDLNKPVRVCNICFDVLTLGGVS